MVRDKVALVTGSSRGIGKAIAERLSRDGASVVVNYSEREDEARETVAGMQSEGGQAIALQANVSKTDGIQHLFDQTIEQFGKIDILVNNAGILSTEPVAEVTEEDFDKLFGVNVKGTFFACQQA